MRRLSVLFVSSVLATSAGCMRRGPLPASPRGPGPTIATSDREASRQAFLASYVATEAVPSGWSGSVEQNVPGATTPQFQQAVLARINYFRAMTGVPADVTFSAAYDERAQKAALMMAARGGLSHWPDASWPDYTPEGADAAANSNLDLGTHGPAAMASYMLDNGANNDTVGHRRWLLHPQTQTMGTGDVEKTSSHWDANALWVVDDHCFEEFPPLRDGFVAWPPKGYVPSALVFPRWSIVIPHANVFQTTVTMARDGVPLPLLAPAAHFEINTDEVIVWTPQGFTGDAESMATPDHDTVFTVSIRGLTIDGEPRDLDYSVIAFDAGATVSVPSLDGPAPGTPPWNVPPQLPTLPTNLPAPPFVWPQP